MQTIRKKNMVNHNEKGDHHRVHFHVQHRSRAQSRVLLLCDILNTGTRSQANADNFQKKNRDDQNQNDNFYRFCFRVQLRGPDYSHVERRAHFLRVLSFDLYALSAGKDHNRNVGSHCGKQRSSPDALCANFGTRRYAGPWCNVLAVFRSPDC